MQYLVYAVCVVHVLVISGINSSYLQFGKLKNIDKFMLNYGINTHIYKNSLQNNS